MAAAGPSKGQHCSCERVSVIEIQPGHPTLPSPTQHIVLTPLPKSKLIA